MLNIGAKETKTVTYHRLNEMLGVPSSGISGRDEFMNWANQNPAKMAELQQDLQRYIDNLNDRGYQGQDFVRAEILRDIHRVGDAYERQQTAQAQAAAALAQTSGNPITLNSNGGLGGRQILSINELADSLAKSGHLPAIEGGYGGQQAFDGLSIAMRDPALKDDIQRTVDAHLARGEEFELGRRVNKLFTDIDATKPGQAIAANTGAVPRQQPIDDPNTAALDSTFRNIAQTGGNANLNSLVGVTKEQVKKVQALFPDLKGGADGAIGKYTLAAIYNNTIAENGFTYDNLTIEEKIALSRAVADVAQSGNITKEAFKGAFDTRLAQQAADKVTSTAVTGGQDVAEASSQAVEGSPRPQQRAQRA